MTQLEKSVFGAGFVAMTEEELYEVNGGRMIRDDSWERPEVLRKDYDRTKREKLEKVTREQNEKISELRKELENLSKQKPEKTVKINPYVKYKSLECGVRVEIY